MLPTKHLQIFCFIVVFFLGQSHGVPSAAAIADVDVIVIGAGPAGIAAATNLDRQGINVKVFEAQSRYGGRVHSIKFGDAYVDLGAEWCHGEEGNVVFEMMKDSHILQHPNYTTTLADSNGVRIDQELTEELATIFWSIYGSDGPTNATDEDTLGSYFTRRYYETIKANFGDDPFKYAYAKLAYHSFKGYILSNEGAFSWFEPSALSDSKDCKGDRTLTWDGHGYKTILEKLMANFDSQKKIHLSSAVSQIILDASSDKVHVVLANNEKHTANHVIFTPSVGVLKHQHSSLFQPPLPAEKVQAIETIGFGAVMKVVQKFPERWWDKNESFTGLTFVWTQEDRDTIAAQYGRGPQKFGQSWLTDFIGVYRVEQNPNVLACWFTGEFVPEIEKLDDSSLLHGIDFALGKFFGKMYNVGKPDKFVRTQWNSNQFIRGSYSFQTIASRKMKPSANVVLSQPITNADNVPKILFAGEATHPYFYATVHGAIESGFREAERLIRIIKH